MFKIVPATYGADLTSNRNYFSVQVNYRTIGSIAVDYVTQKPVEVYIVKNERRLPFRPLTQSDTVESIALEMFNNQ